MIIYQGHDNLSGSRMGSFVLHVVVGNRGKNMKCLVLVQREKGIRNTTDYFSMSFVLCVPFTSLLLCTLYLVRIVSCSYKNSKLVGWLLSAYQVERLGLLSSKQGETDCFSAHLHSLPKRKRRVSTFFFQYPCSISSVGWTRSLYGFVTDKTANKIKGTMVNLKTAGSNVRGSLS